MATLTITKRETKDGPRYHVRYRLGGRAYPIVHGGSFKILKEAKARRDLIAGLLATGQNPAIVLRQALVEPKVRTLAVVADEFRRSRIDLKPTTLRTLGYQLDAIVRDLGALDPAVITPDDVQSWISSLAMKPSSTRQYVQTLRGLLDFAGVEPNPARDRRVRLPRVEREQVNPPSAKDVGTIIETIGPRWRLPVRVLAETGMRVGELLGLEWQDMDERGSRFRIRSGKTATARRWVTVPEWLMVEVAATCPREDRTAERRVFQLNQQAFNHAMARACTAAGITRYSPHDLRHRYISLLVKQGVPITEVAAQVGHRRSSITLDTYAHVLLDE